MCLLSQAEMEEGLDSLACFNQHAATRRPKSAQVEKSSRLQFALCGVPFLKQSVQHAQRPATFIERRRLTCLIDLTTQRLIGQG